jgi:hypothetical protein
VPITFELKTTDIVDAALQGVRTLASDLFNLIDNITSGAAEHENQPLEDLRVVDEDNASDDSDGSDIAARLVEDHST